jgi:hypothetical protein
MWAMAGTSDRVRVVLVTVAAVAQAVSGPLTTLALGPSSNTGAISDANASPVTPAGYAFGVWGLIYAACLALAVYQLLPSQQERTVHRLTGWWIFGAFTASALWVLVFGTGAIWLSQILIVILVVYLASPPEGPWARAAAEEILPGCHDLSRLATCSCRLHYLSAPGHGISTAVNEMALCQRHDHVVRSPGWSPSSDFC